MNTDFLFTPTFSIENVLVWTNFRTSALGSRVGLDISTAPGHFSSSPYLPRLPPAFYLVGPRRSRIVVDESARDATVITLACDSEQDTLGEVGYPALVSRVAQLTPVTD